jgi:hypothetical protein
MPRKRNDRETIYSNYDREALAVVEVCLVYGEYTLLDVSVSRL